MVLSMLRRFILFGHDSVGDEVIASNAEEVKKDKAVLSS